MIDSTKSRPSAPAVHRRAYERPSLRRIDFARWRVLAVVTALIDMLAIVVALVIATALRFGRSGLDRSGPYAFWAAIWLPLWCFGLGAAGLYDRHKIEDPAEELRRVVNGVTVGAAFAIVAAFIAKFQVSRIWMVVTWAAALVLISIERRMIRALVRALRRHGRLRRRALIVGADETGVALSETASRAQGEGLDVVGFVAMPDHEHASGGPPPLLGGLRGLREIVIENAIQEVLVAPSVAASGALDEVVAALDGVPIDLRIAPGVQGFLASRLEVHALDDRAVIQVRRAELQFIPRVVKRLIDLVVGTTLIALSVPIVTLCGLAVLIDSGRPIFFSQRRVGLGGAEFTVWKLRSMVRDAERRREELAGGNESNGVLFKMQRDPRVTRVGRVLRQMSFDELPQLWNVVQGKMSLVGPRPPLVDEVERYDQRLERRLLVKPGLTGLWQVNGRHELTFEEYIRYDLMYVQNWSLILDFIILLKTIPAVLLRRGAY